MPSGINFADVNGRMPRPIAYSLLQVPHGPPPEVMGAYRRMRELGKVDYVLLLLAAAGLVTIGTAGVVVVNYLNTDRNGHVGSNAHGQKSYLADDSSIDGASGDATNPQRTQGALISQPSSDTLEGRLSEQTSTSPQDPALDKYPLPDSLLPYQDKIYSVFDKVPMESKFADYKIDYWKCLAELFEEAKNANVLDHILDMFLNYKLVDGIEPASQYEALAMSLIAGLRDDYIGGGQADVVLDDEGNPKLVRLIGDAEEARRAQNRSIIRENLHYLFKAVSNLPWARDEFERNGYSFLKSQLGNRGLDQRGMAPDGGVADFGELRRRSAVWDAETDEPGKSLFDKVKGMRFEDAASYLYDWAENNFNEGKNSFGIEDKTTFFQHVYSALGFNTGIFEAVIPAKADGIEILAIKYPSRNEYLLLTDVSGDELTGLTKINLLDTDRDTRVSEYIGNSAVMVFLRLGAFGDYRPLGEKSGWTYRDARMKYNVTSSIISTAVRFLVGLYEKGVALSAESADLNIFVRTSGKGIFDDILPKEIKELDYLRGMVPVYATKNGEGGLTAIDLNQKFEYVVAAVDPRSWDPDDPSTHKKITPDTWDPAAQPYVVPALRYFNFIIAEPSRRDQIKVDAATAILRRYFSELNRVTCIDVYTGL